VCGYELPPAQVEYARHRVPLLLRATPFEGETNAGSAERRRRSLDQNSLSLEHCPETVSFLRGILGRLVGASELDVFAQTAPELELVVQCSHQRGLPVARVAPGKLLIVPGTLTRAADSEDSVAAVLAHELAHLSLRHAERAFAARASASDTSRVRNGHEREADITGLQILVNAGYDPWAAIDHLREVDAEAKRRASAAHRASRLRAHDSAVVRMDRLRAQITACSYRAAGPRQDISAAVRRESAWMITAAGSTPPYVR
jgi:Peptidase family M48